MLHEQYEAVYLCFNMFLFSEINECDPNPCEYGGTCEDIVNDYTCTCVTGYTDKNCQTSKDALLHTFYFIIASDRQCITF